MDETHVSISPHLLLTENPFSSLSAGNDSLSRSSSIQSILILSLRALSTLETLLSLPPSSHVLSSSTHSPTSLISLLVESSRKAFFRPEQGVFVSGDKDQISWASQAWAVLAGVSEGEEAKVALKKAYEEGGVEGVTPYLHHYVSNLSSRIREKRQCGGS